MAFLASAAGRHGVLLAVLIMACLACVAPRCEGLLASQHTGHATHTRDHAASPQLGPQPQPHAQPQPQTPPLQPDKKLVLMRAAALGPRLRRQLRFAEAPTDEDDADAEIGEAAERWLLSPHPGGGGSGGGGAAARALGLDDFPPPPPHPKHLLYNAVLPSLPWRKRDGRDSMHGHGMHGHGVHGHGLGHHASYEELGPGEDLVNHHMLRTTRGNRQYDVPQIECPPADDGMERFACPTPDHMGRYRCIDDHVLCDGFIDCPSGEDEDRQACMFYKTTKAHLDLLADALLRWARGR